MLRFAYAPCHGSIVFGLKIASPRLSILKFLLGHLFFISGSLEACCAARCLDGTVTRLSASCTSLPELCPTERLR